MAQAKMTDRLQIIIEANDKASKTFKNIASEAKSLSSKLKGMSLKDFDITPKVKNIGKVKSDLKDVKDEINKLDGKKFSIIPKLDTKQLITDAKKVSTRMRSLLSAGSSVLGTVGTGLSIAGGAAGTVLVQDYMEKQTELAKLQNQTGLADKEFEKLGKTAKDVFNSGIPNSMEVARDAVSLVYKAIGDAPNLDDISLKVVGISETFDKANVEVVRAADQMKTNMGGTFEEALTIITQSFQQAPDYMDDLLDTFNEYGVQAKKAGYSAEGFAETLLSAKRAGAYNFDKPADSLKEFAIRLQSGDKNIKDSYARVRKNLGEENRNFEEEFASDSAEIRQKALKDFTTGILLEQDKVFRTQMFTGAFGTMFEDVGEDVIKSFVNVKDTIDLTKDSAKGLVDVFQNNSANRITELAREFKTTAEDVLFTKENVEGFFRYINENKGPILDGVKAIAKGFGDMAIWIGKNSDKITWLVTKIGEFVSTNPKVSTWIAGIAVLSPVINSALLALQTFIPLVWKLGAVLGASRLIGVAAIGILIWSFYTIRDNWRDAVAMMSIWWGEFIATIRIKWDEFKEIVSGVGDFFVGVWEGVISYVTDMFTNFFGGIGEKFNTVKSWLGFGDSNISAEINPKKTNQLTDLKNNQTGTGGVTVNLNGGVFTDKYSLYNLGQNINQSTRRLSTN